MCTTYTVSSSHRVCQSSRLPIRCLSIDRNEPQPRLGVFLFFYLDFFHSVRLRNAPQWVFFYSVHFFSFHTFAIRLAVLTSARNEWIYGETAAHLIDWYANNNNSNGKREKYVRWLYPFFRGLNVTEQQNWLFPLFFFFLSTVCVARNLSFSTSHYTANII